MKIMHAQQAMGMLDSCSELVVLQYETLFRTRFLFNKRPHNRVDKFQYTVRATNQSCCAAQHVFWSVSGIQRLEFVFSSGE